METRRRRTCKSRSEFELSRIERVLREERRWDEARRNVGTIIYDQRGRVYGVVSCMKGDFMQLWDIERNVPKKVPLRDFTEKYRVL